MFDCRMTDHAFYSTQGTCCCLIQEFDLDQPISARAQQGSSAHTHKTQHKSKADTLDTDKTQRHRDGPASVHAGHGQTLYLYRERAVRCTRSSSSSRKIEPPVTQLTAHRPQKQRVNMDAWDPHSCTPTRDSRQPAAGAGVWGQRPQPELDRSEIRTTHPRNHEPRLDWLLLLLQGIELPKLNATGQATRVPSSRMHLLPTSAELPENHDSQRLTQ
jgi:hypothetical protein